MAIYRDEQGNIISRKRPTTGNTSNSESHQKAVAKYNSKNYKPIMCRFKIQDLGVYDNYQSQNGESTNSMIISCINYCINNNIDISGGIKLSDEVRQKYSEPSNASNTDDTE